MFLTAHLSKFRLEGRNIRQISLLSWSYFGIVKDWHPSTLFELFAFNKVIHWFCCFTHRIYCCRIAKQFRLIDGRCMSVRPHLANLCAKSLEFAFQSSHTILLQVNMDALCFFRKVLTIALNNCRNWVNFSLRFESISSIVNHTENLHSTPYLIAFLILLIPNSYRNLKFIYLQLLINPYIIFNKNKF